MADAVVLYTSPGHLNSVLILAKFTAKYHPSISVIIICNASESAAASVAAVPSITYRRIPDPEFPSNFTTDPVERFFEIPRLQNPLLDEILTEISHNSRIRAFVIDIFCNSAFEVARSLNLPAYYYVSGGGGGTCVFLYFPEVHETLPDIANLNDFIQVPGCPPLHSSDFPSGMIYKESNTYKHFLATAKNMRRSKGVIVNTFDALDLEAKEALELDLCTPDAKTPPVYFIGPLIAEDNANNGETEHECFKWLDLQPSKSVVFLCFGRWGLFSVEQLKEMATGLENSGRRFLWAVRRPPGVDSDLKGILPDGFLERTRDRGFVLESWAPQREILSHDSVAGFVTHCGRSSILESLSIGVPLICWPLYAEQKMNRVFVVEAMKSGIRLEMDARGFVTAIELEKRIGELFGSEKGKKVAERSAELKKAKAVAVIDGGSSVVELGKFINSCLSKR